jgi:hypothetical protein
MLASHGALESAAPLWIGASLTASLDLAVALSLAVAALGAPGPRRVARRTVAVATTPVIIAAVASLAYGHTGALGVAFVVAAFGAAVASIAAGAAPADAPGIFAAPFVAALAIYAFCAADLSGAHATLLHALDLAGSVSQRQDLLTASARPFGAWTTLEHLAPLFALAPMAALAVVTRPLPRGTATVANGVALTALAIALVAFDHHQAARVQVCVNSAMSLARGH